MTHNPHSCGGHGGRAFYEIYFIVWLSQCLHVISMVKLWFFSLLIDYLSPEMDSIWTFYTWNSCNNFCTLVFLIISVRFFIFGMFVFFADIFFSTYPMFHSVCGCHHVITLVLLVVLVVAHIISLLQRGYSMTLMVSWLTYKVSALVEQPIILLNIVQLLNSCQKQFL